MDRSDYHRLLTASAFASALLTPHFASAATIEIGPSANLPSEIAALAPGDELVLQGGTYTLTSRLGIGVSGTAGQPIIVRAKDGEVPLITRDASQNTINIEGASYVTLRGLEVSGGSHGIRMSDASYITIEDCHIHDTADVALSANVGGSTYDGIQILRNHIHDTNGTGEGMYLGCNDAACVMSNSLIEGNYIHHTTGTAQGDGIELKHGSWGNVIRDNVIHDTNYPCIIVYGTAGGAQNIIEGNVMWGCGDHGIQAAADAIIRNNVILSASANGIHNQIHQGATPGNLVMVHNTIVVNNTAIRTNDIAAAVVIANNALYSQGGTAIQAGGNTSLLTVAGNVGTGSAPGGFDNSGDRVRDFVDLASQNAYPGASSILIGAGDTAHVTQVDFNGTARNGVADVGAYAYDASGNPGWAIGQGFKGSSSTPPGGTGGAPGVGGSPGAGGATGTGGVGAGGGAGGAAGAGAGGLASGSDGGPIGGGASGGQAAGGSAAAPNGTSPGDGGTDSAAAESDGGCGCRIAANQTDRSALLGLLLLPLAALRRRRRD